MKLSLSWLHRHLDSTATLSELSDALTSLGLEVEEAFDPIDFYRDFSIAYVTACEPHPNADRLNIAQVQTKDGLKTIVCGASNCRTGIYVIYAPVKAYIPGSGITLKRSSIRGIESEGMLCSDQELLLSEESEGIRELDALPEQIGLPLTTILDIDASLEISITPNRADCLCIQGLARELAAKGLGTLRSPYYEPQFSAKPPKSSVLIQTDACLEFHFAELYNIDEKKAALEPQAAALAQYLRSISEKSISPSVDVTNFVLFDCNHPLHAFDLDKIQGPIVVRKSQAGERFIGLNEEVYTLEDDMIVICDDSGVISLAGIMGGLSTAVTETTKNILIESANWESSSIARTGRKLDLISAARYRFERGVQANHGHQALSQGIALLQSLHPESVVSHPVTAQSSSYQPCTITYSPDLALNVLGMPISESEQASILERLDFILDTSQALWQVTVPAWRADVTLPIHLVEEVGRVHDYKHLPHLLLPSQDSSTTMSFPSLFLEKENLIEQAVHRGFHQQVSLSFISKTLAETFASHLEGHLATKADLQELENPLSRELSTLRPLLLPGLLKAAALNHSHQEVNLAFFEEGRVFHGTSELEQPEHFAGLRSGLLQEKDLYGESVELSVFNIKADLFALLESHGLDLSRLKVIQDPQRTPSWAHPYRFAWVALNPKEPFACFGEVHTRFAKELGLKKRTFVFEIALPRLPQVKAAQSKPWSKPKYPPVTRDFAFEVPREIPAEQLLKAINDVLKKNQLRAHSRIFDLWRPETEGAAFYSLALELKIEQAKAILTSEELQELTDKLTQAALKKAKAKLRAS